MGRGMLRRSEGEIRKRRTRSSSARGWRRGSGKSRTALHPRGYDGCLPGLTRVWPGPLGVDGLDPCRLATPS